MLALLASETATAQTWTGNVSNDWTDPANWNTSVPTGLIGVTISTSASNPTVLGVSAPATGFANGMLFGGVTSSLTVQNGSTLTSGAIVAIGSSPGGVNSVTITGAGSRWSVGGTLRVGGSGAGTLNIKNGGLVTALNGTQLGFGATGSGTLNVNSGGILETTNLTKLAGSAQVNFDNGTLRALVSNPAFINTLTVSELTIAAGGLTVDTNGFDIGSPGFSGIGGLTTTGTGSLTLNAVSTYSGDTLIGSGSTLALTGIGALASNRIVADGTFDISAIAAAGITIPQLAGSGTVVLGTKSLAATEISPGGNAIGTLTIDGDYAGSGTLLQIQAVLGDDNSATDRLVVTGNSSGATTVAVTNVGGLGGVTVNGIKVVDVGGISAGTFSLRGNMLVNGQQAVVGGAYLYGLYQGTPTAADGDWYLRNLTNPSDPDAPLFQPAAPVIESYVASALQAFNKTESLQQRLGSRSWSDGGGQGVGVWGRINADHATIASDGSTTGASHQVGTARLQAGLDGVVNSSAKGTIIGGFDMQIGTVSADVQSGSGTGKVSSTAYGLGTGLTWYGSDGFYVDTQGKLALFNSSLSSDTLGTTIVSGNPGLGYALSLEVGQQVVLGSNWSVTPQAQLSYSHVGFDDFVDPFGSSVRLDRGDSVVGRLGISADYEAEWQDPNGGTGRARLHGLANVNYELLDGTTTTIGASTVHSRKDPLWGGIGLGGSLHWAEQRLSMFGEVGLSTSLNNIGKSYGLGVTAGLKGKF